MGGWIRSHHWQSIRNCNLLLAVFFNTILGYSFGTSCHKSILTLQQHVNPFCIKTLGPNPVESFCELNAMASEHQLSHDVTVGRDIGCLDKLAENCSAEEFDQRH